MDWLFLLAAGCWCLFALVGLLGHLFLRRLPSASAARSAAASTMPSVVAIVPARDEEERIEGTVRGILAQDYPALQLVVVDDGSTDATPDILARLQGEAANLSVLRPAPAPQGWLGKCHACHVGAEAADAEWLLFLDADTWLVPDAVSRALAAAVASGADHFCVIPGFGPCTVAGRGVLLLSLCTILGLVIGVNRDLPFGYFGVGAFTLIRRSAYDAMGGHGAVRMEVVEDFAIGYRVRKQSLRSRLFLAHEDVEVRWAHSLPSFVQVLEKNLFAKLGFRTGRLVVQLVLLLALWGLPILGWVVWWRTGSVAACLAGSALLAASLPAIVMALRLRWNPVSGLLAPWLLPVVGVAAVHSARKVLREGGVRWRGVLYPLAELRGNRRS